MRGISWQIGLVARKVQEHFQHQAFIHIVENGKQDSFIVVRRDRRTHFTDAEERAS